MNIDKILIENLKSNDEQTIRYAFKCVYEKYYKLVCFCISQYIHCKEDVEELANDTFISFFNNIERLDGQRNIKYYLLVTAKNNSINHLRKNNKYVTLTDEMLNNIPYEEEYFSNDIIERLKKILSKEEIIIVVNHLIIGYTFKEIAELHGLSINTVISKYSRALKKANKHLKEEKYND